MAREVAPLDVSDQPDLLRLAQEVQTTQQARVPRGGGQDFAIVTPVSGLRRCANRGRVLRLDDSQFQIIGAAASPYGH